jgi:predicted phosphodiesterase
MQVAIVSDIHGNRHAFEAVLADVQGGPAEAIWCLGDIVGYGADPNDCCRLARQHADVCLAGNHDLAVTGDLDLGEFSTGAALAARWTQEVIDAGHRDWLSSLTPSGSERGVGLYHASPRDPVWEYVLSALLAELCLDAQPERLALVGHSHVALSFVRPEGEPATGSARRGGEEVDVADGEWILNPGSVGQPRDGDARAAWLPARHERLDRALAAGRVRHRRGRGRDPRPRAYLTHWPSAWSTVNEDARPAVARRAPAWGPPPPCLVACGAGDGRIPASDASSLTSALNQISSDYRAGHCVAGAARGGQGPERRARAARHGRRALAPAPAVRHPEPRREGPGHLQPDADPDAGDPDRHGHDRHRDHDTGTTDTGTTDTGTTPTDTGTPTAPTGTTGTSSTGTTTGTDTGTGGTTVGGVTVP